MQVCAVPPPTEILPAGNRPGFREALGVWSKLGWISFGGPPGQIALMHREVVERRKWVDEKHFLHVLNYCMMLPGPEAQQLATYLGWYLHGPRGGVCAGLLFILPAVFILWGLSVIYVLYGAFPFVAAVFYGLVPVIIAIVFRAMIRLATKTLTDPLRWGVALVALVLITFYRDGYPLVVLGAGILGWMTRERRESRTQPQIVTPLRAGPLLRQGMACLAAWITPLIGAILWLGWNHTVTREGLFFSKAALVTFGGAYAVLPYVAQHAVEQDHWLNANQMLHGFSLAETTPGPLIMVLQFIGFLGAWQNPGALTPLVAGTLGSLLTTWVTFAPSFLFILVGAPFVERLIQNAALQSALSALAAAVVGVMANFALWFAWHALFPAHQLSHPDLFVPAVGMGAFIALSRLKMDVLPVMAICAVLGVIWKVLL